MSARAGRLSQYSDNHATRDEAKRLELSGQESWEVQLQHFSLAVFAGTHRADPAAKCPIVLLHIRRHIQEKFIQADATRGHLRNTPYRGAEPAA